MIADSTVTACFMYYGAARAIEDSPPDSYLSSLDFVKQIKIAADIVSQVIDIELIKRGIEDRDEYAQICYSVVNSLGEWVVDYVKENTYFPNSRVVLRETENQLNEWFSS